MDTKIKIPSCGRMVHYFPVLPDFLKSDNPSYCEKLPAIVIEASDLHANITVFSLGSHPCESKFSVPHKSLATDFEGKITMSYWDWPEIN